MAGGRPLLFNNCMDLDARCEMYFDACKYEVDEWGDTTDEKREKPLPLTVTGLAMFLNTSRETLMRYEKKDEFYDTVKKHKLRCENFAENRLYTGKAAGPIFALKNFGWKDKQEQEISGPGGKPLTSTIIFRDPDGS